MHKSLMVHYAVFEFRSWQDRKLELQCSLLLGNLKCPHTKIEHSPQQSVGKSTKIVLLQVGVDMEGDEDCWLLIWPTRVVHVIDQDSPFYHMSAKDFYRKHYEVIVCLEGIVEPTGMSIQARSSYLGDEILWGYRFCNVLHFSDGCYRIDYSAFNKVEKVETSVASARHQKDQQPHQKDSSKEASKDHNVNHHQPHQVQILEYPSIEKAKLPPNYIATCSSNTDQNDGRQSLSMSPMHRRMP
mgnify:CR=1 FL=1